MRPAEAPKSMTPRRRAACHTRSAVSAADDHPYAHSRPAQMRSPILRSGVGQRLGANIILPMELVAGPPSHWIVTLVDGTKVDVWADAVTGLAAKTAHHEHVVFSVLMNIDLDLQDQFEVTARAPVVSRRVDVAVARFPRESVQDVETVG